MFQGRSDQTLTRSDDQATTGPDPGSCSPVRAVVIASDTLVISVNTASRAGPSCATAMLTVARSGACLIEALPCTVITVSLMPPSWQARGRGVVV